MNDDLTRMTNVDLTDCTDHLKEYIYDLFYDQNPEHEKMPLKEFYFYLSPQCIVTAKWDHKNFYSRSVIGFTNSYFTINDVSIDVEVSIDCFEESVIFEIDSLDLIDVEIEGETGSLQEILLTSKKTDKGIEFYATAKFK